MGQFDKVEDFISLLKVLRLDCTLMTSFQTSETLILRKENRILSFFWAYIKDETFSFDLELYVLTSRQTPLPLAPFGLNGLENSN